MVDVRQLDSDRLSYYHTRHRFLHYGEFTTAEEFLAYRAWARDRGLALFILGNGSNTLFRRHTVKSLVLKNALPSWMNVLDDNRVEASSSLNVSVILKHCQKSQLDSFYYLASVPATVGGAIAMNAGRGPGLRQDRLRLRRERDVHRRRPGNHAVQRGNPPRISAHDVYRHPGQARRQCRLSLFTYR